MEWIDEFLNDSKDELISINDEQEIEWLIDSAILSPEEKKLLYSLNSSGLNYEEFYKLRAYLQNNQPNPLTHGKITSMREISKEQREILKEKK